MKVMRGGFANAVEAQSSSATAMTNRDFMMTLSILLNACITHHRACRM
jgi:hypothetical protein